MAKEYVCVVKENGLPINVEMVKDPYSMTDFISMSTGRTYYRDQLEFTEEDEEYFSSLKYEVGNIVRIEGNIVGEIGYVDGLKGRLRSHDTDIKFSFDQVEEKIADKLPTIMDFEGVKANDKVVLSLKKEVQTLLDEYDYEYEDEGISQLMCDWNSSKAQLREMLSKHPSWDEQNQMLILKGESFKKQTEWGDVGEFIIFFGDRICDYLNSFKPEIDGISFVEYRGKVNNLYFNIIPHMEAGERMGIEESYNGMKLKDVESEALIMQQKINNSGVTHMGTDIIGYGYVPKENCEDASAVLKSYYLLQEIYREKGNYYLDEDNRFTDEAVRYKDISSLNVKGDLLPHKGQALTKYYGKILKFIGADKYVKMEKKTWTDQSGNYHERDYDAGYNKYRALLGDAMSQKEYQEDIYISINPVDYLTMSFFNGTASCHTIDENNKRNVGDSEHVYHGMYKSGTISYIKDNSSLVMFTVVRNSDKITRIGREGEENPPISRITKSRRMMIFAGEDKLVCSRLYPDGRDTGDGESIASQWRVIAQKAFADALSVDNFWTLKKNDASLLAKGSGATCFADWIEYNDKSTSFLRTIDGVLNYKGFVGGAAPICLKCGSTHYNEKILICDDCENNYDYHCTHCGDGFDDDDYDAVFTGDGCYCCSECAEADGWVHCEDTCEWERRDDCVWCDYNEEWYSDTSEAVYIDDHTFVDEDSALEYGYIYDDYEEEYCLAEGDYAYDNLDGLTFCFDFHPDYVLTKDDFYFVNEENARQAGYKCVNDLWIKVDEENEEVA